MAASMLVNTTFCNNNNNHLSSDSRGEAVNDSIGQSERPSSINLNEQASSETHQLQSPIYTDEDVAVVS